MDKNQKEIAKTYEYRKRDVHLDTKAQSRIA